jgi:Tol biopolymer transport system component
MAELPRWSPDGKQIGFFGLSLKGKLRTVTGPIAGQPYKIYTVSRDGGIPERLIPDDRGPQTSPNWLPDGSKVVFAGGLGQDSSAIQVLDLGTREISTLPNSQGYFSPRLSPDGRTVAAMPRNVSSIVLFDFQTRKWSQLAQTSSGFPNWSADGKYIYFLHISENSAVLRVRISDRKMEVVADLKDFPTTGYFAMSLSLTPDDSPLLLRNLGTEDVYALDFETP